jgi:hypothetical protein
VLLVARQLLWPTVGMMTATTTTIAEEEVEVQQEEERRIMTPMTAP